MTRPSRNQDKLLVETAKRLLPESGAGKLSLKRIAQESGVNLGMIHYYFRTKSVLIRRVLESIHEELLAEIGSKKLIGNTSLERLRSSLIAIAMTIRSNRKVIVSLIGDVLGRDKETTKFFLDLTGQRIQILTPLIQECQKDGILEPLPFYQILGFCLASINFPTIIAEGIDRVPIKKMKLPNFVIDQLISEKAILQRVDLALKAITIKKQSRL